MRRILLIITALCVFAILNYAIYQKEELKAQGETILLELAPVDPRSLMQGDYMRLAYKLERETKLPAADQTKAGMLVVKADNNKIAHFVRIHQNEPLQPGETLIRFHHQYGNIKIVPDSFMFQEGHAKAYQEAKYGVFKFDKAGNSILTGLADKNLKVIEP